MLQGVSEAFLRDFQGVSGAFGGVSGCHKFFFKVSGGSMGASGGLRSALWELMGF